MSEVGNLTIPPGVFEHEERQEMIRFWIAGNTGHVALKFGFLPEQKDEAYMVGQMLANIAKHYTSASSESLPNGLSADEILSAVTHGMTDGLAIGGQVDGKAGQPDVH